jgi:hypothetical protein
MVPRASWSEMWERNFWKILECGIVILLYRVFNVAICSVFDVSKSDIRSTLRLETPFGGTSKTRRLTMAPDHAMLAWKLVKT